MNEKEEKKYMLFGTETSEKAMVAMFDYIAPVVARVAEHGALNGWKPEDINAATEAAAKGVAWGIKSLKV